MKEIPAISQDELLDSMEVLVENELKLMKQGNDEYAGGANAFGKRNAF